MSEPQAMTRVEVLGRAWVVRSGGVSPANVVGYLTPEEAAQVQKLAEAAATKGVTWEEWGQRSDL